MSNLSVSSERRGQTVAAVGLLIQVAGVVILLVLGARSGSQAILTGGRHMLGGVLIWLLLLFTFTRRKRAAWKDQEIEQLKRARESDPSAALFELEEVSVEHARLAWTYRWLFPITTILLAAYHIVGSLFVRWKWSLGTSIDDPVWDYTAAAGPLMSILAGVGFLCFLYSRYTAGMGRQPEWRVLRSGASYLAGNALACLALVVSVGLKSYDVPYGEPIVAHGIRILLLGLGCEFIVALMLNFYRPRVTGEEPRPSFDSRLLEMVSEPGGVARSIADAINYQFGFEVTSTWFAQLLKRAFFPLLALGVVALMLLSTVVIVDANEQVFVERFGRVLQAPDQPWGPGLHFKWPWPIDRAYRAQVCQVKQMTVGATPTKSPYDEKGRLKPVLWTEQHDFTYDMLTVVATPELTNLRVEPEAESPETSEDRPAEKSVAVSLMNISLPIEYRIKDLYKFLYNYQDPEKVLEMVAFQALSDFAASVDTDELMGPGRMEFDHRFRNAIQQEADRRGLGIEVTFLGLQGAHPPETDNVAKVFQDVIAAEIRKNAEIEVARGKARRILTEVAGGVERAEALDAAIQTRNAVLADPDAPPDATAAAMGDVDDLLLGNPVKGIPPMSGTAAKRIADAQAEQTRQISEAGAKARVFEAEVAAYRAAPKVYRMRKYLDMLQDSLETIRKWVVTNDKTKVIIVLEPEAKSAIDIGEEPPR